MSKNLAPKLPYLVLLPPQQGGAQTYLGFGAVYVLLKQNE